MFCFIDDVAVFVVLPADSLYTTAAFAVVCVTQRDREFSSLNCRGNKMVAAARILASTSFYVFATAASAGPVSLDFEGISDQADVADFYNGGTDGSGNSGVDYGIAFEPGSRALVDADAGGSGNFENAPSGDTVLFFLSAASATMNVLAGFETGLSFYYSSLFNPASVSIYDQYNATGNLLATINLPVNSNGCQGNASGEFCVFTPIGVSFAGTAYSVDFSGTANQVGFDNVTIGSATPLLAVPEPSAAWLLAMGLGLGLLGCVTRQKMAA